MEEIWKDIPNYNGYQVSNLGRVKALKTNKILKLNRTRTGYFLIRLYKNKKQKAFLIHRIVAQAFIPNPANKSQVNHKDGNKANNCINNLEWCTISENQKHKIHSSFVKTPIIGKFGKDNPLSKKIIQINKNNFKKIKIFNGLKEAQRLTGIFEASISRVCNGKQKTAGGYIWRFIK